MPFAREPHQIASECADKTQRLSALMLRDQLDAVLISRHENIAWLTAGLADIRVGLLRETGPAMLLVTKEGNGFYITTNNEAARLADEEFGALPFTPVLRPWTSSDIEGSVRSVVPQGRTGSDTPFPNSLAVNLQPLRFLLTAGEIARYRWLGQQAAEAVSDVLATVKPGMEERALQAAVAHQLISRGLLPSVHLEAVDDRIRKYPHPVPRAGVLKQFAMIGLCARFAGLTAAITRFMHFGPLPAQLAHDFSVVAHVNAKIKAATRPGATAGELFTVLQNAYADAGEPGAEQNHHQGGATGYLEREWVARPGGTEVVTANQAFAWNPNLRGAKVEDTCLLVDGELETITQPPASPGRHTTSAPPEHTTPGVLIL